MKAWRALIFLTLFFENDFLLASEWRIDGLSKRDFELSGVRQCYEQKYNENEIDICVLDVALNYIHPNVHFHIDKNSYEEQLKLLKNRVKSLTVDEFKLEIAKFVAQLQDSHTYVDFLVSHDLNTMLSTSYVSGVVKIDNMTYRGKSLGAVRLLSINGFKPEELIHSYSEYFAFSNKEPNEVRAARNVVAIYSALNPDEKINLSIELNDGIVVNIKLKKHEIKAEKSEKAEKAEKAERSLEVEDNITCIIGKHLIIKIKNFEDFGDESCIEDVMHSISNEYNVVIDLRDNPGGDPDLARRVSKSIFGVDIFNQREKARLFTNLARLREPLYRSVLELVVEEGGASFDMVEDVERELDTLSMEERTEAEILLIESGYRDANYIVNPINPKSPGYFIFEVDPSKESKVNNSIRNVYILTNRNTASSATLFALYAREHLNAKLIGRGIGGDVTPFGSPIKLVLPKSKLLVSISTAYLISNDVRKYTDIIWPRHDRQKITMDYYLDGYGGVFTDSVIDEIDSILSKLK